MEKHNQLDPGCVTLRWAADLMCFYYYASVDQRYRLLQVQRYLCGMWNSVLIVPTYYMKLDKGIKNLLQWLYYCTFSLLSHFIFSFELHFIKS